MAVSTIVQRFVGETSIHGLPKLTGSSRSTRRRVFWAVVCVGAAIVFCFQFTLLMTRYFSYPKKVTVEVVKLDIPFPSVSICNMRNLDVFFLNEVNKIFKTSKQPQDWMNQTDDAFILEYLRYVAKLTPLFYANKLNNSVIAEVTTRASIATNINRKALVHMGVQARDFIATCNMAGIPCDQDKDIFPFFDSYYYNCYTYNAQNAEGDMLAEGLENGLSLITFIGSGLVEQNEDTRLIPGIHEIHSPVSGNEGVRVVIHPPYTTPYPHTEGFDVPRGYSASFGVKAKQSTRIGPPHGNCSEGNNLTISGHQDPRLMTCQKLCLQKAVVDECGCKVITLPGDSFYPDHNYCRSDDILGDNCSLSDSDECVAALSAIYDKIVCSELTILRAQRNAAIFGACGCVSSCHETTYDVSYSLTKWMTDSFDGAQTYEDIVSSFGAWFTLENVGPQKAKQIAQYFKERPTSMHDFSRLNVYMTDSWMMETVESADYTVPQLLSDIGGQLGLWVGISVISLTEVIELMVDICRYLNAVKRGKKPRAIFAENLPEQQGLTDPETQRTTEDRQKGECSATT